MNALVVNIFTSADQKAIFKTVFLPKWLAETKTIFTPDQTFFLLFSLEKNQVMCHCMLSERERFGIWVTKLSNELNDPRYSDSQRERIQVIKDYLTIDIFKEGDSREIFYTQWFPTWVKNSEKVFDSMQIANLIFSLNPIELPTTTNNGAKAMSIGGSTDVEAPPAGCICALNSNFTCPNYTVSWPPSVTYGTCTKVRTCVETTNG